MYEWFCSEIHTENTTNLFVTQTERVVCSDYHSDLLRKLFFPIDTQV